MSKPEVWLRGPIDGITPVLQPVAHALMQASEELHALLLDFKNEKLWDMPFGVASPGFHLQHVTGVIDRLFTYAKGELLNEQQLLYLKSEGMPDSTLTTTMLLDAFDNQLEKAISQLRDCKASELTEKRGVGRAQLPSTTLGLYVHSAEHTMRHVGQLLVTVKYLMQS